VHRTNEIGRDRERLVLFADFEPRPISRWRNN
jgi:hypothetical protein